MFDKIDFKKQVKKEIEEWEKKHGKCVYSENANLPEIPKSMRTK